MVDKNNTAERVIVFDLIRAVACMFVLFGHLMVDVHHVNGVWLPHGYGVGVCFSLLADT